MRISDWSSDVCSSDLDAAAAFARIAEAQAIFASRGDDSGTNKAELRLWREAGVDAAAAGGWYLELGSGMGATLNRSEERRVGNECVSTCRSRRSPTH